MRTRLQGLQRIAQMYMAVKHVQATALQQAAASLRDAESRIALQQEREGRSVSAGNAALDAGEHIEWLMHTSQRRIGERNAEALHELRKRREASMLEAIESYSESRIRFEQMERLLRELRSQRRIEQERTAQLQSDDRFLSRRWWSDRSAARVAADSIDP